MMMEIHKPELMSPGLIFMAPYQADQSGPYIYDNYGVRPKEALFLSQSGGERMSDGKWNPRIWSGLDLAPQVRRASMRLTCAITRGRIICVITREIRCLVMDGVTA